MRRRLFVNGLGALLAAACAALIHGHALSPGAPTQAAGRKGSPVLYVALGDSTGAGVGARDGGGYAPRLYGRIERARPGARMLNLCASAASTADVLHAQAPRLSEVKPTLVTLGVGANDLIRGVRAEQFARDFEALVTRLQKSTDARLVVMNIPDISLAPAVPPYLRDHARRHIAAYNGQLEEIARRHELPVIDLYKPSREFASHPEFFSPDGIHPSDAGYEFWAELLWRHVRDDIGE